ncbi:LysR substrate-binding domain-containing protein [Arthrobacter mobilis]|uniref:LysR family transcriptional regulator n=1 Tax=Arthrobacter mobilis TaxID=2724944 RepID=A0A7X6HBA5_9MICC|nr:LysR substrate-binding domain-containing protein [Arthrobacter mobilis]NKX53204.1 LysR family transcriptional regulator [Arthrobacter mobilis]
MARYTLRQLSYFVAVAETGTIAAAADELRVSPTAVAAAVRELERIFRTQLTVRRKAHGVSLTPAGSYLFSHAVRLLRDAEELELNASSGGQELSGPLVVGCYLTVAATILPVLLEGFSVNHPKVQLDFVEGTQDEMQERLFAGELDLAVVYDMDLRPGLGSVLLYEVAAYVLLPDGHRLAGQEQVTLAALAEDPMILLDAPPSSHHTMSLFEDAGVQPRIRYRTTDFELTRSLVGRGAGYSVLVQRPAVDASYEGRQVVARPIVPAVKPIAVRMIWPEAIRLTDRARTMVNYAASAVPNTLRPRPL